jgi:hypothetical protein
MLSAKLILGNATVHEMHHSALVIPLSLGQKQNGPTLFVKHEVQVSTEEHSLQCPGHTML